jgi:ABC-type amino acid transport substrate-binding protein
MSRWRRARGVPLLVIALCLAGCGVAVPSDPQGTLERVRGGELRAGASPSGSLVTVEAGEVGGTLADLVDDLARSLDARVTWTVGSEEDLVDGLESGDLDLVIGGMTDATPWTDRAGVTRAYDSVPGASGPVVLFVPLGENAWQAVVERHLDEEVER